MFTKYLNRVVVVAVFVTGLAGAVAIPLINADFATTAGIIAAVAAAAAEGNRFLIGWQAHEARVSEGVDRETGKLVN